MFKKPVRTRSNNRIKGSERKRLKQNILSQFQNITEDQLLAVMPNKEDVFIKKLETQNGDFLTCFCTHKNPLFFVIDKEKVLYPTVYVLWQLLDAIPYMVTWPNVFEKICHGADLMLPGVLTSYGGFGNIIKGEIMGVRLAGNKAAVAMGVAAVSSNEISQNGMKGKGVNIYHWYSDNLWSLCEEADLPVIPDVQLNEKNDELDLESVASSLHEIETTESKIQDIPSENKCEMLRNAHEEKSLETHIFSDEQEKDATGDCEESQRKSELRDINVSSKETSDEPIVAYNVKPDDKDEDLPTQYESLTPEEEMDLLLENCFLQALIDAKKVELPMLVSTFSSQFLHAACPEGMRIDIKKSKYKKMGKFLQEMEKQQLLKVGEVSKGVLSITEINLQNESLREFKATDFAKDKSTAKKLANAQKDAQNAQEGIQVVEMFAVSGKTKSFFKLFQSSKGQAYTCVELRQILTSYVKDNELVNQNNKRLVNLDPILSDVLFDKNFRENTVTWDVLFTRFQDKMNPCHKVILNGRESQIKKGKMEPVEVKVEQRMGNKKVTLVKNLEQFGIDPNEFAHQIQLAVASSTTVSPLPGKNISGMQVLIQGNQTVGVSKLLEEFSIPKKYIFGLDKLKSKAKKW